MAFGNFTVSTISSQGIKTLANVGLAAFIILGTYRIIQAIINKKRMGAFINYDNSNLFDQQRHFKVNNIKPLLANGLANMGSLASLTYSFKFAALGGINQGVILTLMALSSVYNLITFYFLFKEKVGVIQLLGMALMLCCVGCIGYNSQQKDQTLNDGVGQKFYATLSIFCGLFSPLFMTIKHYFIRTYKKAYNTWDLAIDGLILEYFIYMVMAVYLMMTDGLDVDTFAVGTLASIFLMIAKICIALAVANGLAGPSASLLNT